VEYLAKAIISIVSLLGELFNLWANNLGNVSANVAAQGHGQIGDSLSSIFTNGVNFIAALAAEILHLMSNTVS